ncbi:Presqualene diphosphate phosphatase [Auxenochlorella protothecoides]|uniref:Presqualene diphosphate phosphatase n=1 Tax=Auxenochlorella protothecoides TaxID=3075 RepID=A0A087SGT4_AUXPR|nr:Presqualene diphosphate phosphatase [Auxenochlorella protothecoides]KFM24938.1 Presqualene diphosphate phosphatase [Auxenochlorella protothecoides]RMZ52592.1 hypothetical protein APUTEX25_000711 [Auxenochlorella protothecoides]|eukprot:RMZ52592.1 hypothetical protein APUTEX25_000711 [Auxenochlorella protothecoides]
MSRSHRRAAKTPPWLGVLVDTDERWSNYLYILGTAYPRFLWLFFEYSGDGIVWLAIALAAFFQPRATLTQQTLVLNFLAGWALDLVLVGTLKFLIRRRRPVYNVAEDFLVVVAVDAHSFPSGHAARVSFIAQFLILCLGRAYPRLSFLAMYWAVSTALSRAAMGRHYLADVAAGLLVGVGTVLLVSKVH